MNDELRRCLWKYNTDNLYTPGCVKNHGYRVNANVKINTYRFCPYCGKPLRVKK